MYFFSFISILSTITLLHGDFPYSSVGKESTYNVGDLTGFNPWVGKIPWRRKWLPTPVFWPGEFHGLYSPWGLKELDMTERLSLHTLLHELLLHENKAVPVFIKHTLLI